MRLKPLSGLDAGFLYLEAAGTPMHVGSLMLVEPPKRRGYDLHAAVTAVIAERLPKARALRRQLVDAPLELAHPMWGEAAEVDFSRHITRETLPRPGTRAKLLRRVADLHADPLPRDRPLWRFVVIEGLADGQVAFYSKIHHAMLDGQGGVALAHALLDLEAVIPRSSRRKPDAAAAPAASPGTGARAGTAVRATIGQISKLLRAVPGTLKLAGAALSHPGATLESLREGLLLAPRTPLNVHIGPERRFAIASVPLDRVKRVAKARGVSLNDVVLAMVGHALREHLARRKALPAEPMVVAMPISLRASGDAGIDNQVSMVQCLLPTQIRDPGERLAAIRAATSQIKARVSALKDLIPTDFPGLAAPLWATGLSRLWARGGKILDQLPPLANLVVSNVPGPPVPLYLAGSRVVHYYPVSIVTHGLALNITVHSYAGWLEFGLIAASEVIDKPETLARGLERGLAALDKEDLA